MISKGSRGRYWAKIAGAAVLVCAVLVGIAYFVRYRDEPSTVELASLETSPLYDIFSRCAEDPVQDFVDGRARTRCGNRSHPAFMMEVVGEGEQIESAAMMVPLRASPEQLAERIQLGLEMFGLLAGVQAEAFLPPESLAAIGKHETSFVFQGYRYSTHPVANVGLVFAVRPKNADDQDPK